MDDYTTATLEKIRFGLQQAITSELLMDARVSMEYDHLRDLILTKISGSIWSEQLDTWEIKYPADWWQSFKERWAPEWAKRRWPVIYQHFKLDLKALYPEYRVSVPDQQYRPYLDVRDWKT